jgi:formylglycine-generating enzyme required for sulfatase activity
VGVLFISHSSQDDDKAVRVRDWLHAQGWREVFLDLDAEQGLAPGHHWQDELKRAGERCAAVLVLVSPDWLASFWCRTEFLLADQLGKRIFPIFVAPTPFDDLPIELKAKFQIADISVPEKEADGFQRLAVGLRRAGLDPDSFDWPPPGDPNRPVFRGLQALDVDDAAVFFGRDAAITKGLDELRQMRGGAPERVLVVLGASGAGKSSFLRAGLVSRLKRDEDSFQVLPIIRPGRAALTGPEGLEASLASAGALTVIAQPRDLVEAIAHVRRAGAPRPDGAAPSEAAKPATVILPVDQAEELFAPENTEGAAFCSIVAGALDTDSDVLVLLTIRSDAYARLQADPSLGAARQRLFNLAAIPAGWLKEVIEGPAKLARPPLAVEPELTQALLADLASADALPLLAFTLERLQTDYGRNGKLTVADYREKLGGIAGAIQAGVAAAIGPWPDPHRLALARRLFIPALVQIDQDGVRRRIASRRDVPAEARSLADAFVEQRILIADRRTLDGAEIETLEVAHEAILRQWPTLAAWIAEEGEALAVLAGVRSAARDWRAHQGGAAWLVHGGERLKAAQATLAREDFAGASDQAMRAYVAACRAAERRATRGRRRLQGVAAVLALVLLAGLGWAGWTYHATLGSMLTAYQRYRPFVNSAAKLAAAAPGTSFQDCGKGTNDCPVMLVVPAGQFMMGSPDSEPGRFPREGPVHPVAVRRFALSKFDVTVGEWRACVQAGGCPAIPQPDWAGDRSPVVNVSWNDARAYADWLSQMTGVAYRLPSEAEWEYAARGETTLAAPHRIYPWGDALGTDNADCQGCGSAWDARQAAPVGSFRPNAFGLYDMAGEVWQWVQDCVQKDYTAAPWCGMHSMRGGAWDQPAGSIRSAYRGGYIDYNRSPNQGLRIARTL